MRVVVVTGSASGLGAADGRARALAGVRAAAGTSLEGLVACAGLGPQVADHARIVAVNYFGATAILDGLRPLLAGGDAPAAVAISSNSATIVPEVDGALAAACLAGDEREACRIAGERDGAHAYAASKLALARWVRRNAPGAAWAGAGIRLNAVAPGAVETPLLQEGLDDPQWGPAIRAFPIPLGGFGAPQQIAAAVDFLLGPDASFCCGTVLYADGGSDALVRGDRY
jgi:NAD(P)-dependent dehydrogenase (short-subunit alcohol dehydrogenase family)